MIQHYRIFSEGDRSLELDFDDQQSVKELVRKLFDENDYYEPFGLDIVTLFQSYSSRSVNGWFITEPQKSCAEVIESPDYLLCIAYYMPGKFYFAEGGWGHHMIELGNHPRIHNPVSLNLEFEDFRNTVVIAGDLTFANVFAALKRTQYISDNANGVIVHSVNPYKPPYKISINNPIMHEKLSHFVTRLPDAVVTLEIE